MRRPSSLSTPSPSPLSSTRRRRRAATPPRDVLAALSGRFAQFRREHPQGARVPADLRAAVLAALRDGEVAGDVHRACGISWGQVAAWKASSPSSTAKNVEPEVPAARVFEVVEDPRRARTSAGGELELRVGPWSVTVRLADDAVADGE